LACASAIQFILNLPHKALKKISNLYSDAHQSS
jgi:hypothetical protein